MVVCWVIHRFFYYTLVGLFQCCDTIVQQIVVLCDCTVWKWGGCMLRSWVPWEYLFCSCLWINYLYNTFLFYICYNGILFMRSSSIEWHCYCTLFWSNTRRRKKKIRMVCLWLTEFNIRFCFLKNVQWRGIYLNIYNQTTRTARADFLIFQQELSPRSESLDTGTCGGRGGAHFLEFYAFYQVTSFFRGSTTIK